MRAVRAKIVTSVWPIVLDVINASGLVWRGIRETFSFSLLPDRLNGRPMKYLVIQGKFLAHVSVKGMRTAERRTGEWFMSEWNKRRTEGERAVEMNQVMNFKHACADNKMNTVIRSSSIYSWIYIDFNSGPVANRFLLRSPVHRQHIHDRKLNCAWAWLKIFQRLEGRHCERSPWNFDRTACFV